MRTYQPYSRRSRIPTWLFGGIATVLLLGTGILTTLWMLGAFSGPAPEDPYMVRIPINSQPIPAYMRVDRNHLFNPTTGGLLYQRVPPASTIGMSIVGIDTNGSHIESRVESAKNVNDEVVFVVTGGAEVPHSKTIELGGAMMNINAIIGRVVKRDKRAGLGFTETTFFPQGTPEGIAGATPEGMRAMTLDATKLTGVHALNAGDQIDLMASVPVETSSINGDEKDLPSEPTLLAQNAIVLKPVYVRNEASTSASLTQGTRVQNIPKYEVAIAVKPDDIIPLQSALNRSLGITCITHSMKPVEAGDDRVLVSQPDRVAVPVTVRSIYAYDVISRDAFVSQATRVLKTETLSRQEVDRLDIITSLDDALGAIARHDIPAGRYIRRGDLINGPPSPAVTPEQINASRLDIGNTPTYRMVSTLQPPAEQPRSATAVGDRPAITRFVPPGRTAFAIPWNRIYGAEHLQIGDEIDLMASYSLESTDEEEETETRPDGTVVVRKSDSLAVRETQRTWDESFGFRAEPWFVASDAIVIAPVGFPPPAAAARALGDQLNQARASSANASNGFSGPPVIVAVEDRDVESVAAALATRDALFTVAFHSHEEVAGTLTAGSKQIVICSEPIAPYQEFNENLWKGNRRRITTRIVTDRDPRFADAITVDEVQGFFGRVVGQSKARGDYLTEADFLPEGTVGGLAAGVKQGHTFFVVADRDIEALDSFQTGDRVAILIRGVVKPPQGASVVGIDYSRPVSNVVVNSAMIARASLAGQTVLDIENKDLNALQAAIARSITDREGETDRSHLVAVVLPRENATSSQTVATSEIPGFDPFANVRYTEVIVGKDRSVQAFGGSR